MARFEGLQEASASVVSCMARATCVKFTNETVDAMSNPSCDTNMGMVDDTFVSERSSDHSSHDIANENRHNSCNRCGPTVTRQGVVYRDGQLGSAYMEAIEVILDAIITITQFTSTHSFAQLLGASASVRNQVVAVAGAAASGAHGQHAPCVDITDQFCMAVVAKVMPFYQLHSVVLRRGERHEFHRASEGAVSLSEDGINLRPCERGSRTLHEGTNGYWAHGAIRVGGDVAAGVWNFEWLSKRRTVVGLARDSSAHDQQSKIDLTEPYDDWLGMDVWFMLGVPGNYQLKLRPYSDEYLLAELIFEGRHSRARYRCVPKRYAPYHIVALVESDGDWFESPPPCLFRLTSSSFGCLCVCASARLGDCSCYAHSHGSQEPTCATWDVPHLCLHSLRSALE